MEHVPGRLLPAGAVLGPLKPGTGGSSPWQALVMRTASASRIDESPVGLIGLAPALAHRVDLPDIKPYPDSRPDNPYDGSYEDDPATPFWISWILRNGAHCSVCAVTDARPVGATACAPRGSSRLYDLHLQGVDLIQWSGHTHHFQLADFYATHEFPAGLLGRAAARLDWPGATPPLALARRLTGCR